MQDGGKKMPMMLCNTNRIVAQLWISTNFKWGVYALIMGVITLLNHTLLYKVSRYKITPSCYQSFASHVPIQQDIT